MNRARAAAAPCEGAVWRWLTTSLLALVAFGALLAASPSFAQPQGAPGGDADPPGRAARLAELTGNVWLWDTDAGEWIAISRNRPLTGGDRIATDNGARAEIWLGSTTIRVDGGSEVEVAELDDDTFRVHLIGGSVESRLRSPQALAEFSVTTDEGRFRAQAVGSYRFDRFDHASDLTVLSGQAVFEGRNSALPLSAGQHARFWLDGQGAAQYSMSDPPRDAFASWIAERNRIEQPVVATRYVSPEMTGAEDLDRHGRWEQSPEYGPIWYPRVVAADWVPYSTGHWSYVRPWGWTWVDDAPWGFAPFHYGRWVHYRNRWCWAPGSYVARPVYAPALVAWVGGSRGGVSIRVGAGGPPVGWFPLAPREVYVPAYRASPRYVRNVNITHVTNVTQITTIVNNVDGARDRRDFANRRFPHAVTVAPASVFGNREQVHRYRGDERLRAVLAEARPGAVSDVAPVGSPQRPKRVAAEALMPQLPPPFADGRGWRRERDDDRRGRDDDRRGRDDDRRGRDDDRRAGERRDGDRRESMPGSDRRDGRFDRDRGRTDGVAAGVAAPTMPAAPATMAPPPRGPAMREPNADAARDPRESRSTIGIPPRSEFSRGDGTRGDGPRDDGSRRDAPRGDGQRSDGSRGDGSRGDGSRGDGSRGEGSRGDGPRGDGSRGDSQRSGEGRFSGDRVTAPPRAFEPRPAMPPPQARVETPQRIPSIEPQRPMAPAVRPLEGVRPAEPKRPAVEPMRPPVEPMRPAVELQRRVETPPQQRPPEQARPQRDERREERPERRENRMERGGPSERSR